MHGSPKDAVQQEGGWDINSDIFRGSQGKGAGALVNGIIGVDELLIDVELVCRESIMAARHITQYCR